jgi:hypothetical protein
MDPGEAGAIKSQDHSRASLQVIRRFCLTVSFFAVWAMARQQLDPMLHFGRDAEGCICGVRGPGSVRQSTHCRSTVEPLG